MSNLSGGQINAYVNDIIQLSRPANLLLPLIQVWAGYLLINNAPWQYAPLEFYTVLVCLVLIHSSFTILNDFVDRDIDIDNKVESAITTKTSAYRHRLLLITIGMVILSCACLMFVSTNALWLILAEILLSTAYNMHPLRFSVRPIASIITLGVTYSLIPFLLGVVAAGGTISWNILLLASCWAFVRMSISILKDFKDKIGDKKHNKRTFLLVFGDRLTRRTSSVLSLVGIVGIAFFLYPFITESLQMLYILVSVAVIGVFLKERLAILSTNTPKMSFEYFLRTQLLYDIYFMVWIIL